MKKWYLVFSQIEKTVVEKIMLVICNKVLAVSSKIRATDTIILNVIKTKNDQI